MSRFLPVGLALLVSLSTACRRSSEPQPNPVAPEPDRAAFASSSPVELLPSVAPTPSVASSAEPAPRLEGESRPEGTRDEAKPPPKDVSAAAEGRPVAKPAAASVPKVVRGPVVGAEQYSAYLQTIGRYAPGETASLVAIVAAKGEYKCNDKYPTRFTVSATSGLTAPNPVVTGALAGKTGSLAIPVDITSWGSASLAGQLKFSVCSAERCLLEKQDLRLEFEVD